MKTTRIAYWITTSLFAVVMSFSAYFYLTQGGLQGFRHLGLPDWFRVELAVAKFIGAVVLLVPAPTRFKEWAYGGFAFTLISALVAHNAVGDPVTALIAPLVGLAILAVSYVTYGRLRGLPAAQPQPARV
ncbi:MAG: DoxX family protein [Bacteroidetes bacterium]|nr:DoxX family protein [Fibrella sp.]